MIEQEYVQAAGSERQGRGLDNYFVDVASHCPYGLDQKAVYHQAVFGWIGDDIMTQLLEKGYRRNGNSMYTMHCPDCSLCVPIRLDPGKFKPNRNQRRVLKKNRDVTVGVAPLTMSKENLNLLESFLTSRFPESNNHAEGYYAGFFITSITRCFEIRYRVNEKLVGVAIVDASTSWLNAVYFYFDPEQSWRSLGTYNILNLVNFCNNHRLQYLYLGYWIKDLKGMDYKKAFNPHQLYLNNRWVTQ